MRAFPFPTVATVATMAAVAACDPPMSPAATPAPAARSSGAIVEAPAASTALPPDPSRPRATFTQPTGAIPAAIAGFRFGMSPAEFRDHCREVGRLSTLVGNDSDLRLHTCDGVEVEPGMRLNMFLGFCDGDTRLCEINYWTDRNPSRAFPTLNAMLVQRYGNAPVDNRTMADEALPECATRAGKIRRTWWWGSPSDITGRVLLAVDCAGGGGKGMVGVYFDDPIGAAQQVKRAKTDGTWPF
jgi:hypothetical protein